MPETIQRAEIENIEFIIDFLIKNTQGPREAYATLCSALVVLSELNAEETNEPVISREQLIEEVSNTLRSVVRKSDATH